MLNAKKLQQLRLGCGWTQTQMLSHLAKEQNTYCSQASLIAYEKGRVSPKTATHVALARLFDVEPEDLLI